MRQTDCAEEIERDNKNQVMLKKEQLKIRVIEKRQLLIEEVEKEVIEKIKKLEANDNEIVKAVKKIKKTGIKVLRNDEQQIENKLILKKEKYMF